MILTKMLEEKFKIANSSLRKCSRWSIKNVKMLCHWLRYSKTIKNIKTVTPLAKMFKIKSRESIKDSARLWKYLRSWIKTNQDSALDQAIKHQVSKTSRQLSLSIIWLTLAICRWPALAAGPNRRSSLPHPHLLLPFPALAVGPQGIHTHRQLWTKHKN